MLFAMQGWRGDGGQRATDVKDAVLDVRLVLPCVGDVVLVGGGLARKLFQLCLRRVGQGGGLQEGHWCGRRTLRDG